MCVSFPVRFSVPRLCRLLPPFRGYKKRPGSTRIPVRCRRRRVTKRRPFPEEIRRCRTSSCTSSSFRRFRRSVRSSLFPPFPRRRRKQKASPRNTGRGYSRPVRLDHLPGYPAGIGTVLLSQRLPRFHRACPSAALDGSIALFGYWAELYSPVANLSTGAIARCSAASSGSPDASSAEARNSGPGRQRFGGFSASSRNTSGCRARRGKSGRRGRPRAGPSATAA